MNLRQAAQQALEVLEGLADYRYTERVKNTMASLRAALAEPEQEPVAWRLYKDGELYSLKFAKEDRGPHYTWEPLYTAPTPQPDTDCHLQGICQRSGYSIAPTPRKPLTEDEIADLWDGHTVPVFGKTGINPIVFARAIERAHGIGGGE